MAKKKTESVEAIKFGDAMSELETILARLDQDEVDLDDLAGMVERAAHLIRTCRERIVRTEGQVRQIIHQLADEIADDEGDSDEGPSVV